MSFPILPIHLGFLAFSLIVLMFVDKEAFAWFTGKKELLDAKKIKTYHRLVWIGLTGLILTGATMAWPARLLILENPLFLTKLSFVLALVINGFVIGRLNKVPTSRSYSSLTTKEKIPLFLSGAVSVISWFGAIITAFILFGNPFF